MPSSRSHKEERVADKVDKDRAAGIDAGTRPFASVVTRQLVDDDTLKTASKVSKKVDTERRFEDVVSRLENSAIDTDEKKRYKAEISKKKKK